MAQKVVICDGCRSCIEEPDELWELMEKAMNSETCHCECLFALQKSGTKIQPPALTVASILNHIECVKTLIDAGADVNVTTTQKYDGSECTGAGNGMGLIDEIYAVNKTALIWAADMGNSECVNKLVTAGADVNKMDIAKCTALTYAAKGCQGGCMKILIEVGADVNIGTGLPWKRGNPRVGKRTALMWLLNSDLQAHRSLADGESMFYHMNDSQYNARIRKSSRDAGFDALLEAGADVNIVDEMGRPALTYAAMLQDKPQYVKKLLDAGANVNLVDFRGISPLLFALIHRAAKNVYLLLKAGAVLYAENPSAFFDSVWIFEHHEVNTSWTPKQHRYWRDLSTTFKQIVCRRREDTARDTFRLYTAGEWAIPTETSVSSENQGSSAGAGLA